MIWQISVSDLSAAGSSAQGIPSAGVPVPGVGSGGGLSPPPPEVQLLHVTTIFLIRAWILVVPVLVNVILLDSPVQVPILVFVVYEPEFALKSEPMLLAEE